MAAARYPGGLRPHPPGRCPGPRPSSEMPPEVTAGTPAAGHLPAGRVRGAAEPPPRSRAPPASQAMTLRVTLDLPGEPAAQSRGARRGDAQAPGGRPGGLRPPGGGSWTAQLDRCSIKQKRKMIRPAVPSGDGTVEDNGHPDESIWGESSLHQTRGDPANQLLHTAYLMVRGRSLRSTSTQGSTPRPARRPRAFSMQHGLLPKEGSPHACSPKALGRLASPACSSSWPPRPCAALRWG